MLGKQYICGSCPHQKGLYCKKYNETLVQVRDVSGEDDAVIAKCGRCLFGKKGWAYCLERMIDFSIECDQQKQAILDVLKKLKKDKQEANYELNRNKTV